MSKKAAKRTSRKSPTKKAAPSQGQTAPLSTKEDQEEESEEAEGSQSKMGRPTKYKAEFAKQAEKLCELGATDDDLANFFDVSDRTITRWQTQHKDFCRSLKLGKDEPDGRVERSLYHRAVGYTFESEKVFQFQGEIVRTKTVEHVPPDTTAMIFWLKNRKSAEWRDKQEVEVTRKKTRVIRPHGQPE